MSAETVVLTLCGLMAGLCCLAVWAHCHAVSAFRRARRRYVEHMLDAAYWSQRPIIETTYRRED
jgi:hypothetical protein